MNEQIEEALKEAGQEIERLKREVETLNKALNECSEEAYSFQCLMLRIKEVSGFKFDEEKALKSINQSEPDQLVFHILGLRKERYEMVAHQ